MVRLKPEATYRHSYVARPFQGRESNAGLKAPRYSVTIKRRTSLALHRRARQRADSPERCLRRVQPQTEILVGVRRKDVGRLVPLRVPAVADLRAALVFAQADGRDDV